MAKLAGQCCHFDNFVYQKWQLLVTPKLLKMATLPNLLEVANVSQAQKLPTLATSGLA